MVRFATSVVASNALNVMVQRPVEAAADVERFAIALREVNVAVMMSPGVDQPQICASRGAAGRTMSSLKIDGMPNVVEARCKACVNTIGTSSDLTAVPSLSINQLGTAAFRIEFKILKITTTFFVCVLTVLTHRPPTVPSNLFAYSPLLPLFFPIFRRALQILLASTLRLAAPSMKRKAPKQKERKKKLIAKQVALVNAAQNFKNDEYLCDLTFENTLPRVPFHPKLLRVPFARTRITTDAMGQLRPADFGVHPEPNLGVLIDMVDLGDKQAATAAQKRALAPEDLQILDTTSAVEVQLRTVDAANKRSLKAAPWMRKTQYIENDLSKNVNNNVLAEAERRKWAANAEQEMKRIKLEREKSGATRVERIVSSFDKALRNGGLPTVHPSNPLLKPVQSWPLVPDLALWPTTYALVGFDSKATGGIAESFRNAPSVASRSVLKQSRHDISVTDSEALTASYMLPAGEGEDVNALERKQDYLLAIKHHRGDVEGRTFVVHWSPESAAAQYFLVENHVDLRKTKKGMGGSAKVTLEERALTEEEEEARQTRMEELGVE